MKDKQYKVPEPLLQANLTTKILSLDSSRANCYGRLIQNLDVTELLELADSTTSIDPAGNTYVPSVPEFERSPSCKAFLSFFGGMPIEIGYCNGPNQTINGLEYHKSPELFIAVTDCVQFLCKQECLREFAFCHTADTEAFYFPKGSVFLLHPCILHLAPCAVHPEGFKSIIILPKGTNLPLEETNRQNCMDPESRLLFKRNKWMIAHPQRTQLISQGVHPGLEGENRRIVPSPE